MNRLILLAMFIVASCTLFAQNSTPVTYTVKGVLVDSLTMEGEPYATIRIMKKEAPDKPVKLAVTDTNGKFQEQLTASGDYIMSITSIGKTTVNKEFTLSAASREMDFGTLFTSDNANELGTVEVIAQKPLVRVDIDKIEYNIEDDPDSETNSVLEMLRKVPLVTVDGEENIQVNGSSSFKIHVNGKPNNMMSNNPKEVLKSMPANSIKHIEVITDPGAKYDAEGVGGILNIVTIEGRGLEGYTVTLSGNANNMGVGGSAYGTVQKGKLTVTGNYSYNYNDRPRSFTESTRQQGTWPEEFSHSSSKGTGNFQHGNIEASYEIDTLRLVTLSFGLYGGGDDSNSNGETEMPDNYYYRTLGNSDNSWFSMRGSIDYQRMFKLKGRMLTFSYRLGSEPETNDSHTNFTDEDVKPEWESRLDINDRRFDSKTNTMEHTFQADYVTPMGEYHTFETGAKYIIRNNTSDTESFQIDNNGNETFDNIRSVDYKHLNNILAAYAGYTLRYKALSGKAGLRYEHTILDMEDKLHDESLDKNYDNLVPSASIGVKLGQSQNLRAGYNMRIWRPSIYFLNPYVDRSNPTSISYGNKNLDTEKSHNFNLSYSSFTSKFNINLSLRYSVNNNSIERYSFVDENEILNNTYDNIGKTQYTGMSLYINWNASPLTRIYVNANGGYNDYRSPKLGLKNSGWDIFMYGGIQQTLPFEIRASLNLMGASDRNTLQGKRDGFYNYHFSLNKSFLDKRLTVSAFAGNIFNKYRDFKNTTIGDGFRFETKNKYPSRRFGISISYRIGELQAQVKKAARTITNDDVKSGDGGGESGGGE